MSCVFLQCLNALLWMACGSIMVVATDALNNLMATQYPWFTAPVGWGLIIYSCWLLLASRHSASKPKVLPVFIAVDYGWSLLIVLLISTGQVIVAPAGIRVAMLVALFTAALGALLFRHYKLLMGKY